MPLPIALTSHHLAFRFPTNGGAKHRNSQSVFLRTVFSLSTETVTHPQPIQTHKPKLEFPIFQEINQLCDDGKLNQALLLLQNNSNNSDSTQQANAIGALLQASGQKKELEIGRKIDELISSSEELSGNVILNTRLVTMFSMCNSPLDSRRVFDGFEQKNLFLWNALISGYTRNEMWEEAMSVFCQLTSETDFKPDNFTLPCVIKACAGLLSFGLGQAIHSMTVRLGLGSDVFSENALIAMYGKCGFVEAAFKVFDSMSERNLVSWNSMMFVFSENGFPQESFDMMKEMVEIEGLRPDVATFVTILPVCAAEGQLEIGRVIHAMAVKLALNRELTVNNALVDMYSKCGWTSEAQRMFEKNLQKNVVSWNAMLAGLSRKGDISGTLDLLRKMPFEGMKANAITLLNVLPACLEPSELKSLKELHGYAVRHGFQYDELVANAFVAAYAKCGLLDSADKVFYEMNVKGVGAWNALIGGHAQNGDPGEAVDLFLLMTCSGTEPDRFTIGSILLACSRLKCLKNGEAIHAYVLRNGLGTDSFIGISLLSLYIHCGKMTVARLLFNRMDERNLVTWNTMIAGYSQSGQPDEALALFRQMQYDGIQPLEIAMMSAIAACAELSALRLGKEVHCFALKGDFTKDPFVGSSIIDMYAKCGCIEQSERFFDRLREKDAISWNVMIAGYGIHGHGKEAIDLFERMGSLGFKPDRLTFIGVLMACSHARLVEDGLNYFEAMRREYSIEPKLEHYACVVDMLGRAGRLAEAAKLVDEMPEEPDAGILGAFVGACRIHGEASLGEKFALKLLELDPDKAENYVSVSNLYAGSGRWEEVRRVRGKMKEMGLQKEAGCSWIEVGGRVYEFLVWDFALPKSEEIRRMWSDLEKKISMIGYVPDTSTVLHEVEEEKKVEILRGHSEKLAIAFGLLNTSKGMTVRVSKNLRICTDCHNAAKLVSKVAEREIVVRDNKRFHHFKDGFCSCGDYW